MGVFNIWGVEKGKYYSIIKYKLGLCEKENGNYNIRVIYGSPVSIVLERPRVCWE